MNSIADQYLREGYLGNTMGLFDLSWIEADASLQRSTSRLTPICAFGVAGLRGAPTAGMVGVGANGGGTTDTATVGVGAGEGVE